MSITTANLTYINLSEPPLYLETNINPRVLLHGNNKQT